MNPALRRARQCVLAATFGTVLATVSLLLLHSWVLYGINVLLVIVLALLGTYNYGIVRATRS